MARNIRWFVTFKSLNGTNCRVNIYDNDWPAGVTLGLQGAADPFFYEEEDSDDLLNDVLRYRTGYIRVIEQTYGALDDIYPASTFDRYVEFIYGGNVEFNGYIQVQDFSRVLEPGPRVIELPVISPMGLFDKRTFSTILPPTTKTLGQLLDIMLAGSNYTKVTVPDITGIGLWQKVFSLVVCPWNENYHQSMNIGSWDKLVESQSYAYLIEGICKAFGWICHDTPQALVFTCFDHTGQYAYYPVGHIGDTNYKQTESVTAGEYDLTDYYEPADNDANIRTILPDTGIEVKYEGELGNVEFKGFDHTRYVEVVTAPGFTAEDGERWSLCNFETFVGLNEISGVGAASWRTSGQTDYLTVGNFLVAWNGYIGVLLSLGGSTFDNQEMFRIRHYDKKRTGRSWHLLYDGMSSRYAIGALEQDDNIVEGYIQTTMTINDDYVEVVFKFHHTGSSGTWPQLPDGSLIFIHNIRFEMLEDSLPYAEYRYAPATDSDSLPSATDHPAISSSVTMPISLYRLNDHMIGDTLRTTKLTEYPYLFQRRQEVSGIFRRAVANEPALFHTRLFSYLSQPWRIIAQAFHPWDDEYKLTLQGSRLLNVTTYDVIVEGDNVSSIGPSSAIEGESLQVTLYTTENYDITSVTVTMGSTDITSSAYSNGVVNIDEVTGDVMISVVTTKLYDAKVEWLQGNGGEYIETGINCQDGNYIIIDCVFTGNFASTQILAGFSASGGNWFGNVNNTKYGISADGIGNSSTRTTAKVTWNITSAKTYLQIGNTTKNVNFNVNNISIRPFCLFGIQSGYNSSARIFSVKLYDKNDLLIADFIPVRNGNIGYIFDKISHGIFGNANSSGSFSYGNDI